MAEHLVLSKQSVVEQELVFGILVMEQHVCQLGQLIVRVEVVEAVIVLQSDVAGLPWRVDVNPEELDQQMESSPGPQNR